MADGLADREITLRIGGLVHDLTDPTGKLLFGALAMIAEFDADLIRVQIREGMSIVKSLARFRGNQPKLTAAQSAIQANMWAR
ncbi:MAG: hypothetical protein ACTHWO_05205 [Nesterenkonia sp.]